MDVKDLRRYLEAADACNSGPPVKWGTSEEARALYEKVDKLVWPFWSEWGKYHYGTPPKRTGTFISNLLQLSDEELILAWSVYLLSREKP